MLAQPEHSLSLGDAFAEVDQVHYSLGDARLVVDAWQGNLVRTEMNTVLQNVVLAMNDELGVAFDKRFGTDTTEWKEIDVFEEMRNIVAQAASRFTVGLPLCKRHRLPSTQSSSLRSC